MNEATLRRYVRDGLHRGGALTTHHEDLINVGLPDVSYSYTGAHGWIELKWTEAWPKRSGTPLRLPHYTPEQKYWLLNRGRAGGRCWLLLRVGREHLIFDHERAQHVGGMDRLLTCSCAKAHWKGGRINFEQLLRILK